MGIEPKPYKFHPRKKTAPAWLKPVRKAYIELYHLAMTEADIDRAAQLAEIAKTLEPMMSPVEVLELQRRIKRRTSSH